MRHHSLIERSAVTGRWMVTLSHHQRSVVASRRSELQRSGRSPRDLQIVSTPADGQQVLNIIVQAFNGEQR
jgi:hypothetical protein